MFSNISAIILISFLLFQIFAFIIIDGSCCYDDPDRMFDPSNESSTDTTDEFNATLDLSTLTSSTTIKHSYESTNSTDEFNATLHLSTLTSSTTIKHSYESTHSTSKSSTSTVPCTSQSTTTNQWSSAYPILHLFVVIILMKNLY